MLRKIALGTANFTQSYGVLPSDLDNLKVQSIIDFAMDNQINAFDTAFAYGDFSEFLKDGMQVITKFSVFDDYGLLLQKLRQTNYYALLVHDPHSISKVKSDMLLKFFDDIRKESLVKKIGVSVYDFKDLREFENIIKPDLIQIPLNPLNQAFLTDNFVEYVNANGIEVHARSLFLQGVLLSDTLPKFLNPISDLWQNFKETCGDSRLKKLLGWAFAQKFVDKWVLGISSIQDLLAIINCAKNISVNEFKDRFEAFKMVSHSLIDPRNWKSS